MILQLFRGFVFMIQVIERNFTKYSNASSGTLSAHERTAHTDVAQERAEFSLRLKKKREAYSAPGFRLVSIPESISSTF